MPEPTSPEDPVTYWQGNLIPPDNPAALFLSFIHWSISTALTQLPTGTGMVGPEYEQMEKAKVTLAATLDAIGESMKALLGIEESDDGI